MKVEDIRHGDIYLIETEETAKAAVAIRDDESGFFLFQFTGSDRKWNFGEICSSAHWTRVYRHR